MTSWNRFGAVRPLGPLVAIPLVVHASQASAVLAPAGALRFFAKATRAR